MFLNYDQEELDAAYDQASYAPNLQCVMQRFASASEEARRHLGDPRRLSYGTTAVECLDLYSPSSTKAPQPAPVVVYIHGGAWRGGLARDFAFPAEVFVRAGAYFLVPDFTDVLAEKGDLRPMAKQVHRALAWVVRNAASFGGDRQRVYVVAHSSGAHLTSAALVANWGEFGLPQNALRGAVLLSGMYDLRGPRLSSRRLYVSFTDEVEDSLSAVRHVDSLQVPAIVAYGSLETPEFQRQAWEFAEALRCAGKPVRLIRAEGYNHFEIAETLASPFGVVGRAALELVGGAPASAL